MVYRVKYEEKMCAAKVKLISHSRAHVRARMHARTHAHKPHGAAKVVEMSNAVPAERERTVRVFNAELKLLVQVDPSLSPRAYIPEP